MIIKSFIFNHVYVYVLCVELMRPCRLSSISGICCLQLVLIIFQRHRIQSKERQVSGTSILIYLWNRKEQRKNSTCPVILTFNMDWEGVVGKGPCTQINLGSYPGSASYCVIWSKILSSLFPHLQSTCNNSIYITSHTITSNGQM